MMNLKQTLVMLAVVGSGFAAFGTPSATAADPVESARCLEEMARQPESEVSELGTMTGGDAQIFIPAGHTPVGFAPLCVTILDNANAEILNSDAIFHNPNDGLATDRNRAGKCFIYNAEHGGSFLDATERYNLKWKYDAASGGVSVNADGRGFKNCPASSTANFRFEADRVTIPYFCTIHTLMTGEIVVLAD